MLKKIIFFFQEQLRLQKESQKERISVLSAQNKFIYILKNWLFSPFIFAALFSLPIYFSLITYQKGIYFPYISAILGLISMLVFINVDKRFRFMFGFFVGICWFYWIGLSFRFTSVPYFGLVAVLFASVIYGILFWFACFFNNKIWRAIALSLLSYAVIFDFDWFVPDALFAFSVFKVDKISFIIIVAVCAIVSVKWLRWFRFLALAGLVLALDFGAKPANLPNINMLLSQTNIPQNEKWDLNTFNRRVNSNLSLIESAISQGYKVIVMPETVFTFALNKYQYHELTERLLELSKDITIVLGAQREDLAGKYYNSTYVFRNNSYKYADKVFLAPFGEYSPIPLWAKDIFTKVSGTEYGEFERSAKPKNINVENLVFRNAICYEATTRAAYEDKPRYMMLISNNAWFKPSIEPALQMLLIKYYSRLYGTSVFHSANGSNSMIIAPEMTLGFIGHMPKLR